MLKWGKGASTPTTYTPNRPIARLGNINADAYSTATDLITR
ncbi:MAG: hypothetical protein K0R81_1734 [Microbacterium sp.]|nr:hypothetical protein [Microbacterium sp.]